MQGKFGEILEYAVTFISHSTVGYSGVWWRLFHIPNKYNYCIALQFVKNCFIVKQCYASCNSCKETLKSHSVGKFLQCQIKMQMTVFLIPHFINSPKFSIVFIGQKFGELVADSLAPVNKKAMIQIKELYQSKILMFSFK